MLSGCQRFSNPFAERNLLLAEAGGEKLYQQDVAAIFTPGLSAEDSLKLLRSYVDQWVKKQIKVAQAEQMFQSSQKDIDRLVAEYRNSLLTHKVDQYYVDHYLDTLFTDNQIASYYNQHLSDFVLDKPVLKARIVRLPRRSDQRKTVEELLLSPREESYQDLVDLCLKNDLALTELSQWTELSNLIGQLPISSRDSNDELLSTERIHRFETDEQLFCVRIVALRRTGEYVPLESVTEAIRRVLFNQRKEEIIRGVEDSLYRRALTEKQIEVFLLENDSLSQ